MLRFVLNTFYIYTVLFVIFQEVCGRRHHHVRVSSQPSLYLNEFTVKINGNNEVASAIARRNGFINLGQVGELEGWYTFINHKIRKRSLELHDRSQNNLRSLKRDVLFVERLKVLSRPKRDRLLSLSYQSPNDASWEEMWYMHCGGANRSVCPCSMRITDAWRAKYNGEGVVVTILDDGIERTHPDLIENYDPDASRDINDNDADPMPRYDPTNENKHGTRCAGVVAASLNNQICGAGVAFRASIGGIRMLDGDVTDKVEALSLMHAKNHTDIYSASWGPDDDGVTVEGPGPLAKSAFEVGALKGRGGKGSIFIWASGNGGHNRDSCSCDGYINTIYTIGISSVSQYGNRPWYLESCASTLASTYSSGDTPEGKVITTDLRSSCTHEHTGTSASAPMAAGVVALMLQANPELTWRDVQHVIVRTSKAQGLRATDWVVNGAGYKVSHVFGYGLLDAAAATHVASRWREVPEQKRCMTEIQRVARDISPLKRVLLIMTTPACHNGNDEIGYLEHVVLRITLSYSRRGELNIFLTSPSGTKSNILEKRHFDRSKAGFREWEFMTTHHWGERASGVWKLQIEDNITSRQHRDTNRHGQLIKWQLIFYGTRTDPQPGFHFESCDAFPQDQCHAECVGCCSESAWECKACRHMKTTEGKCVAACSSNEYAEESERVCRSCWPTCLTCNGPTDHECTSCSHGYAVVNGACVKICNQGQYLEGSTQTCRVCDEVCKTCQGRSSRCTSCRDSFIFEGNTCRPSCPDGQFFLSNQIGCAPCQHPCYTCSRTATRCQTCVSGFVRYKQRCLPSCPQRYFPNPESNICQPCHPSCRSCSGPNRNECTRCSNNQLLQDGVCTRACTDGQIGNFGQNHCLYVKKLGLCLMDFFSQLCCNTCEMFTEYDTDFYEYYLEDQVYDEDANVEEEQSADNSTSSLPLVGDYTSLPET